MKQNKTIFIWYQPEGCTAPSISSGATLDEALGKIVKSYALCTHVSMEFYVTDNTLEPELNEALKEVKNITRIF